MHQLKYIQIEKVSEKVKKSSVNGFHKNFQ